MHGSDPLTHHALFGGLLLLLLKMHFKTLIMTAVAAVVMGLYSEGVGCCSNLGKAMLQKLMR
jgi:hypothetical protein